MCIALLVWKNGAICSKSRIPATVFVIVQFPAKSFDRSGASSLLPGCERKLPRQYTCSHAACDPCFTVLCFSMGFRHRRDNKNFPSEKETCAQRTEAHFVPFLKSRYSAQCQSDISSPYSSYSCLSVCLVFCCFLLYVSYHEISIIDFWIKCIIIELFPVLGRVRSNFIYFV